MKELKHTADRLYFAILDVKDTISELEKLDEFANYEMVERQEDVLQGLKIAYKETLTALIKEICE